MKFNIIVADPPWHYNSRKAGGEIKNKSKFGGGCEKHYNLMKDSEILDLAPLIKSISNENCALFLWATCPKLDLAISVIKEWGFEYKTVAFTWVKTYANNKVCYNPGYYTSSNSELLLLGIKQKQSGFFQPDKKMISQIITTKRLEHSQKPEIFQDNIDLMYPNMSKIELFSRRWRTGWLCIGDELTSNDIRFSLQHIIERS
jgi:site-specific DNA-methyltransferase (adenine-specific)